VSAAEKLAEDIEARPKRTAENLAEHGIIKMAGMIARATRADELANLKRVQESRPLAPPSRFLAERYVAPGRIDAAKVRRAEVRIELYRFIWPDTTGES
jgi:hypothetical protein